MKTIQSWCLIASTMIISITNGRSFVMGTLQQVTWSEAVAYCNQNEAGIAVIRDADENTAAVAACEVGSTCWIGLNSIVTFHPPPVFPKCEWSWSQFGESIDFGFSDMDGTMPLNMSDGGPWEDGEIAKSCSNHCGALQSAANSGTGLWRDLDCSDRGDGQRTIYALCNEATDSPTSAPTSGTQQPSIATGNPTSGTQQPSIATGNPTRNPTGDDDSSSEDSSDSGPFELFGAKTAEDGMEDMNINEENVVYKMEFGANVWYSVWGLVLVFIVINGIVWFMCRKRKSTGNNIPL